MGSRIFDGSSNWWQCTTESFPSWNGCTFAAIMRPAGDGTGRRIFRLVGSPNTIFRIEATTNRIGLSTSALSNNVTMTTLAADGWQGIAITKPTGTTVPTIYKTIIATGVTVSGVGGTAISDPAASASATCVFGAENGTPSNPFNGDIHIAGIWAEELSSAQVASLWTGRGPWFGTEGLNAMTPRVTLAVGDHNRSTVTNFISGRTYTDTTSTQYVPDLPPRFAELDTPRRGSYIPEIIPGG